MKTNYPVFIIGAHTKNPSKKDSSFCAVACRPSVILTLGWLAILARTLCVISKRLDEVRFTFDTAWLDPVTGTELLPTELAGAEKGIFSTQNVIAENFSEFDAALLDHAQAQILPIALLDHTSLIAFRVSHKKAGGEPFDFFTDATPLSSFFRNITWNTIRTEIKERIFAPAIYGLVRWLEKE